MIIANADTTNIDKLKYISNRPTYMKSKPKKPCLDSLSSLCQHLSKIYSIKDNQYKKCKPQIWHILFYWIFHTISTSVSVLFYNLLHNLHSSLVIFSYMIPDFRLNGMIDKLHGKSAVSNHFTCFFQTYCPQTKS